MLNNFFRHTCHKDTFGLLLTYIPGILQQQWKKNIGLAARMNWIQQMNKIYFAEDSLDCMTAKCQKCVIIVLCTKSYYRPLQLP